MTLAERDVDNANPFGDSESTALTLRYDVRNDTAVKAQWQRASPDATVWLNADPMFLLRNDRNVYTISMDFVF